MRILAATLMLCSFAWALSAPGTADAADMAGYGRPTTGRIYALPFLRSDRAQSVWDSGACWSECGSQCTWRQAACLETSLQGQCLAYTDSCDRYCQRSCRTSGGPFLPIDF
jgi:hypothetical protein